MKKNSSKIHERIPDLDFLRGIGTENACAGVLLQVFRRY